FVHVSIPVLADGRHDERWMRRVEIRVGDAVATAMVVGLEYVDAHTGIARIARLAEEPGDCVVFCVAGEPHGEAGRVLSDELDRDGAVVRVGRSWEWPHDLELRAPVHRDRADGAAVRTRVVGVAVDELTALLPGER